jgi:hypothetical protein
LQQEYVQEPVCPTGVSWSEYSCNALDIVGNDSCNQECTLLNWDSGNSKYDGGMIRSGGLKGEQLGCYCFTNFYRPNAFGSGFYDRLCTSVNPDAELPACSKESIFAAGALQSEYGREVSDANRRSESGEGRGGC